MLRTGRLRHSKRSLTCSLPKAPVAPGTAEAFAAPDQRAGTVWFTAAELALVTSALQDQHAAAVRLAVDQFAIVAAGRPHLGAITGLAADAPLALVGFERQVILEPLSCTTPLRQPV